MAQVFTQWRALVEQRLIVRLNRLFGYPGFIPHIEEALQKDAAETEAEEFQIASDRCADLRKWTTLEGKVILDLCCGHGIKTAGYASAAPKAALVIGIDIDQKAIRAASLASQSKGFSGKLRLLICDASALPFKGGSVDIVISENAFEHVAHPEIALREVARIIKPQGLFHATFFPLYYSPYGSHLWNYLHIPWVHVFASQQAVIAAKRRIVEGEKPRLLRKFAGRVKERDIEEYLTHQLEVFQTLNKLTPRRFRRLIMHSGVWIPHQFEMDSRPSLLRLLGYVPGVDRFFIWRITLVLRRADGMTHLTSFRLLTLCVRRDLRAVKRKIAAVGRMLQTHVQV